MIWKYVRIDNFSIFCKLVSWSSTEHFEISLEGCSGYSYEFDLTKEAISETDMKFERDGAIVGKFDDFWSSFIKYSVTDEESIELMDGSTIDYSQELIKKSFVVTNNPLADSGCSCGASFSIEL